MGREPALGDGHTDAVGNTLTERASCRFDSGGQAVFRVSRSLAAELAEILKVVKRQGGGGKDFIVGCSFAYPGKINEGVEKHRGVSVGQDKAVAVGPDGIQRIVAQELLPQTVGDRSESHGRSGMAGVCFLDGVHGKSANRVDTELVELRTGGD